LLAAGAVVLYHWIVGGGHFFKDLFMTIEDVAERADVWSESIKKIIKAISAAGVALAGAVMALLALWPSDNSGDPIPPTLTGTGYSPQCSQLYNTIEHTWTEQQWAVWETLKRDMDC
tara:strand:+ start:37 stop:387 length:351 start_codon:yes stop_codon:yes gene_type:complete